MKKGGKEKKGVLNERFFSISKLLVFLLPIILSLSVVSCKSPSATDKSSFLVRVPIYSEYIYQNYWFI